MLRQMIIVVATCLSAWSQVPVFNAQSVEIRNRGGVELMGGGTVQVGEVDGRDMVVIQPYLYNPGPKPAQLVGARPGSAITSAYMDIPTSGVDLPVGQMVQVKILLDPKAFLRADSLCLRIPTTAGALALRVAGTMKERVVAPVSNGAASGTFTVATNSLAPSNSVFVRFEVPSVFGKVTRWWLSDPEAPVQVVEGAVISGSWCCNVAIKAGIVPTPSRAGVVRLYVETSSGDSAFTMVQWRIEDAPQQPLPQGANQ